MGKEEKEKRKRISQACDACNRRKTRCDGLNPSCSTCLKLKVPCTYDRVSSRKKEMETIMINSWNGMETTTLHIPVNSSNHQGDPLTGEVIKDGTIPVVFDSLMHHPKQLHHVPSSSSTLNHLHFTFNQDLLFKTHHPNSFISSPENVSLGSIKRNVNWRLIDLFFEFVNPLIPVFSKEAFYKIAPFESTLLLNTMYAMAAKFEKRNGNYDVEAGKANFQIAINEVSDHIAKPNTSVVYALFLLCYYGACKLYFRLF